MDGEKSPADHHNCLNNLSDGQRAGQRKTKTELRNYWAKWNILPGFTYLEKNNKTSPGKVVYHIKGCHALSHQNSNGIKVVPKDQPKFWYVIIVLRSSLDLDLDLKENTSKQQKYNIELYYS